MRKLYFSFLIAFTLLFTLQKTSAQCFQNFDAVVAPALPAGWSASSNVAGASSAPWVTTNASSFSGTTSIFTNNATDDISDEWLTSEPYAINSASAVLTFRNKFDLEATFDGMVLEISVGGGPFADISTVGTFVSGGYNGTINSFFGNPLAGRQAWTGTSSGFILTTVNLPASANGQNIVLRWRRGTDDSFGNSGVFIDNVVICGSACINTPASVTTDPISTIICAGGNTSFTVAAAGTGISYQWQVNTGSGFTDIPNGGVYSGATTPTLNITGAPFALNGFPYRATIIGLCNNVNSAPAILTVNQTLHSNVIATPSVVCSPGSTVITGTASGTSSGNFTHTLTGPGTIVPNPPTGVKNANASFSISAIPAGNQTYILTSTGTEGCPVVSNVNITVNATPVITLTQTPVPLCAGQIQQIAIGVTTPTPLTFTQPSSIIIPDGQPVTTSGIANPYPSQIVIGGLSTTGVTVKSVKLGNVNHTFPGDMDIVLVSPTGQAVVLMSDAGGDPDIAGLDYTFDDGAAASMANTTLNPQGTYKPTNFGATDNFPAPGPGSLTQGSPTLSTFTGNPNGTWKLYIVDDGTGDFGFIGNWSITFNTPTPVVFSPVTSLFTDAAATTAYTGTPVIGNIYSKPASGSIVYTANAAVTGCPAAPVSVTVTVNQPPVITAQPAPATQTACLGTTLTYTVTATGTGITYQWRKGGVALVNGVQASGSSVAGATTNSLTLTGVVAADAGSYDVTVTGASCAPAATSSAVALLISSTPTITTQPANVTVCDGGTATFSVVAAGTPAPTVFQWQVSTTAVPLFTNIIGGNTATLTIPGVNAAMNGNKYRVIITNSCGQNITSNGAATLTISALTTATATALPATICLSDMPIALTGLPVGGSWSGIGISGSNFIPAATAVGSYTLTYTYNNPLGCASTATLVAKVSDCPERLRLLRDNAVILFPNPSNGNFKLRINSTLYNNFSMKVFTSSGTLVHSRIFTGLTYGQVVPVDLSHLPSNTYFVHLFYDGGAATSEKVIPIVILQQ